MTLLVIKTTLFDSLLAKYPTINQRKDAIIKVKAWRDNAEYIENNCDAGDIISVEGWIEIDTYKKKRKSDPDTLCLKCARDGIEVLYKQTRML
jgi:single-stranded DNA-binding protein